MSEEKILIISDEEDQRNTYAGYMKGAGYNVIEAESCDEGLRLLATGDVALALVDIVMPGKSGLECLEYAKEHYPELPVVMMSGDIPEEFGRDSVKMGAADFLAKPIPEKDLLKCIGSLLGEED